MDCSVPVDDLCYAREAYNFGIPEQNPDHNLDQFFIKIHMETLYPLEDDEEEEDSFSEDDLVSRTRVLSFWKPCPSPRLKRDNLSMERISSILTEAGVPLHKQDHMVHHISAEADNIANAAHNQGKKVLLMLLDISIIACYCCDPVSDDSDDSSPE